MAARFLDTNILVRLLTRDDEEKAARALLLIQRVESGEEQVITSPMVLFEAVFILQRRYGVSRAKIRDDLGYIVSLRGLRLANKTLYLSALDLYVDNKISFTDAFNAAFMRSKRLSEIYTWDTDFDILEGIARVEPAMSA